jgi:hypothetical protein
MSFCPPTTKSNAEKKACPCNGGDKCSQFRTFFKSNSSELGEFAVIRYSDSCNFVNFYRAAINFLGISEKKQQELKEEYDKHKADPKNIPFPRLRIPKFHFPFILALTTKQWTAPMSRAVIDELECYTHRSPNLLFGFSPKFASKAKK